jgi:hypothetical protein
VSIIRFALNILSVVLPVVAVTVQSRGCLIIPASSSLAHHLATDTACPTWLDGSQTKLPTARSHFALDTGAYRSSTTPAAPSIHADWLSLSVSHCGTWDMGPDRCSFVNPAPTDTMRLSPIAGARDLLTR